MNKNCPLKHILIRLTDWSGWTKKRKNIVCKVHWMRFLIINISKSETLGVKACFRTCLNVLNQHMYRSFRAFFFFFWMVDNIFDKFIIIAKMVCMNLTHSIHSHFLLFNRFNGRADHFFFDWISFAEKIAKLIWWFIHWIKKKRSEIAICKNAFIYTKCSRLIFIFKWIYCKPSYYYWKYWCVQFN